MYSANHPTGVSKPVLGSLFSSRAALAAITPLLLLTPLAAHAEEPKKIFIDSPLTDEADTITIEKTVDLTEDSDFGGGTDMVTNNSVITIGAHRTAPTTVNLINLETLKNQGLIDMRNGHVGDVLHVTLDYYGATANSRIGLDIGPNGADKLVVDSTAYGGTMIVLGGVTARTATLTGDNGPVLVQASGATKSGVFRVENGEIGLVRYGLLYDDNAKTYRLKSVAGLRSFELLKVSEGVNQVWRRSADAWSAHVMNQRDSGGSQGAGVWGQMHGQWLDRDDIVPATGRDLHLGYRQTTYGGQMGVDLINNTTDDSNILLGVTGGYSNARIRFSGVAGQLVKMDGFNLGAYTSLSSGGYFFNALAKVDRQSINVRSEADIPDFDATSFGGLVEVGGRSDVDGLGYEQLFSLSYVSSRLDDIPGGGVNLDFDRAAGFLAKAGVRTTLENEVFGGALTFQGGLFLAHDFTVKNAATLSSGDTKERLLDKGARTFGQLSVGLTYKSTDGMIAFLETSGDYGGGREGGSVRIGARYGF